MLEELIKLLKESRRTIAFTGAGVSTLSGIRDFRGKHGVYLEPWQGKGVEEILSLPCFLSEPELFYGWAKEFIYRLEEFHSSVVHRVLAGLEKREMLHAVYTQNIDLLHQKAGSRTVYELHGSPSNHHCLRCKAAFAYATIAPQVLADKIPHCPACNGLIKPDIIFYGEQLNESLLEQAFAEIGKAELLLVLGSSLTVQPAASLPLQTLRNGGKVVIVNAQPTTLAPHATLRFNDLQTVFDDLEKQGR